MLNTDRGLDNFMIKCCDIDHEKAPIDTPPVNSPRVDTPQMSEIRKSSAATSGVVVPPVATPSMSALGTKTPGTSTPSRRNSHIHIAAIDNSLSFPHEHPRGWRSYTYGWLYLPVSIIGRPFSEGTRNHFLPLLTSKTWWEETSWQLRELFALDPDFHPRMFRVCLFRWRCYRGLTVVGLETTRRYKGTGVEHCSIVEACGKLLLMSPLGARLTVLQDEGPLELTRRQKVLVWDDELESTHETFKPEDEDAHANEDPFEDNEDRPSSPHASISTMPLPAPPARLSLSRPRVQKVVSDFPSRRSADFHKFARPVSFATTYNKVHPGTTGVAVLEQMERLDAVEASLKKLGGSAGEDNSGNADREVDVAEASTSTRNNRPQAPGRVSRSSSSHTHSNDDSVPPMMIASFSGPFSPGDLSDGLPAVAEEAPSSNASEVGDGDEDFAQMSKSMSYMDGRPPVHSRWASQDGNRPRLDWIIDEEMPKPKMVVVEVRNTPAG
jgi:phosphatidylinositol 4-kinase type 2